MPVTVFLRLSLLLSIRQPTFLTAPLTAPTQPQPGPHTKSGCLPPSTSFSSRASSHCTHTPCCINSFFASHISDYLLEVSSLRPDFSYLPPDLVRDSLSSYPPLERLKKMLTFFRKKKKERKNLQSTGLS